MKIPGYWSVDWYLMNISKFLFCVKLKKLTMKSRMDELIYFFSGKKEQTVLKDFTMLHFIYNQDL